MVRDSILLAIRGSKTIPLLILALDIFEEKRSVGGELSPKYVALAIEMHT